MTNRTFVALLAASFPISAALAEPGKETSHPIKNFAVADGLSECDKIAALALADSLNAIYVPDGVEKLSWVSPDGVKGKIRLLSDDTGDGSGSFGKNIDEALDKRYQVVSCVDKAREDIRDALRDRFKKAGTADGQRWVEAFLNSEEMTLSAQLQESGRVQIALSPNLDDVADEATPPPTSQIAEGAPTSTPDTTESTPAAQPGAPSDSPAISENAAADSDEVDPWMLWGAIGFGSLSLVAIAAYFLIRQRKRLRDEADSFDARPLPEVEPEIAHPDVLNEIMRLRNAVAVLEREVRALKNAANGGDTVTTRRAPPLPPPPPPIDFNAFRKDVQRDYQNAIENSDWAGFQTKYRVRPLGEYLRLPPDSFDWNGAKVTRLFLVFPEPEMPSGLALIAPDATAFVDADEGRFAPSIGRLFRRESIPESRVIMRHLPTVSIRGGVVDQSALEQGIIACPSA